MADLFVSYSRADRDRVAPLVAALQAEGWGVWWDTRLWAGEQWDDVIEREIKSARCVLVVWSVVSVTSRWVRDEARYGLSQGILVPVRIDAVEQPLGFGAIQMADLIGWKGEDAAQLRHVIESVRAKLGLPPAAGSGGDLALRLKAAEAERAERERLANEKAAPAWWDAPVAGGLAGAAIALTASGGTLVMVPVVAAIGAGVAWLATRFSKK